MCPDDRIGACGLLSVFDGSSSIVLAALTEAAVCFLNRRREGRRACRWFAVTSS